MVTGAFVEGATADPKENMLVHPVGGGATLQAAMPILPPVVAVPVAG